jgi:hypothetical protein
VGIESVEGMNNADIRVEVIRKVRKWSDNCLTGDLYVDFFKDGF